MPDPGWLGGLEFKDRNQKLDLSSFLLCWILCNDAITS